MSLTKSTYSMIDGAPINVLDFGAVGDGTADDTAAIQRAVDYAATVQVNLQYTGSSTYVNAAPTIVFPAGVYRVSSTISLNALRYARLIGDGKSLIIGAAATTKTVTGFSATGFWTADLTLHRVALSSNLHGFCANMAWYSWHGRSATY